MEFQLLLKWFIVVLTDKSNIILNRKFYVKLKFPRKSLGRKMFVLNEFKSKY